MPNPSTPHSTFKKSDKKDFEYPNTLSRNFILLLVLCLAGWLLSKSNTPKKGTLSFYTVVKSLPNDSYQLEDKYLRKMNNEIEATRKQKPRTLLFEEITRRKDDGSYELSTQRQQKSEDIISKFSSAEQYALKAATTGYFPCPSCPFKDTIFLIVGEVYRYGITLNGSGGRGYSSSYLKKNNLKYFIQFEGDLVSCKVEEVTKIFSYPLLIENLKRNEPIARPPGNPVDN